MTTQADHLRTLAARALERIDDICADPLFDASKHRVMTITSGKGGVGKTFIAVNAAVTLAKRGKSTLLFDADLGLANVDVQLGLVGRKDLSGFASGQASLSEVICNVMPGLDVLSGGAGFKRLLDAPASLVSRALSELAELSRRYDLTIIDTGAGLSDLVRRFLFANPRLTLVTTAEPTALTDAYAVLKTVGTKERQLAVSVVLNMCAQAEALRAFGALERAVGRFIGPQIGLEFAGYVPKDDLVSRAVLMQRPFVRLFPEHHTSQHIEALSSALYEAHADASGNFVTGALLAAEGGLVQ